MMQGESERPPLADVLSSAHIFPRTSCRYWYTAPPHASTCATRHLAHALPCGIQSHISSDRYALRKEASQHRHDEDWLHCSKQRNTSPSRRNQNCSCRLVLHHFCFHIRQKSLNLVHHFLWPVNHSRSPTNVKSNELM